MSTATIEYKTESLRRSLTASMENYGAVVMLAKRSDGVSAVLTRVRRNQTRPLVRLGYARFGKTPVWCERSELPISSDETLGAAQVRELVVTTVERLFTLADESEYLSRAAASASRDPANIRRAREYWRSTT